LSSRPEYHAGSSVITCEHADADRYSDEYAYEHTDSYQHADEYAYSHGNVDVHPNSYEYVDTNEYASAAN
jgi:hypothetical protein